MRSYIGGVLAVVALAGGARAQESDRVGELERSLAEQQRQLTEQRRELERMRQQLESIQVQAAGSGEPVGAGGLEGGGPAGMAGEDATPPGPSVLGDAPVRLGLFFIESADGRHRLEINGRLQVDGRFVVDRDHDDFDNEFQVRRARVDFSGKIYEKVSFKLGLEFGRTSDADLRDAYLNLEVFEWLQLRAGQMLVPFSTERLTSSNYMKFPERPIIIGNIIELRDIGVMVHGHTPGRTFAYYLGVYNGTGQNVANDDDDDKDVAARLEFKPLKALLLAGSYRYTPTNREESRGPADYRTVGNQLTEFLTYDGGNRHLSHRERGTLDARMRAGPLEVKGELVFDYHRDVVSATGARANLMNWGWFIDTSFLLTGEEQQDTIDPASPFFGEDGFGTGAFEVSVRYEEFHADPATLRGGFASGTRSVRAVTTALGWYPAKRVRVLLSYTYTDFAEVVLVGNEREDDDHAVIARLALYW